MNENKMKMENIIYYDPEVPIDHAEPIFAVYDIYTGYLFTNIFHDMELELLFTI